MLPAELAELGPFFTVESHAAGSAVSAPWLVMSDLVENPALLRDRVSRVRDRLAEGAGRQADEVETRVAASVTHLGIVARLVSPALATAAITGVPLDVGLATTRWQPVLGGAVPLSVREPLPHPASTHAEPEEVAGAFAERVLEGPVRDLVEATRPFSVSARVLWGNVASAVNGATTMISTAGPAWSARAGLLASHLLNRPPLLGTSTQRPDGRFQRRSCCLIYRVAPDGAGAVCGDCVLTDAR